MQVTEKSRESKKRRRADHAPFAQDIFELKADQSEISNTKRKKQEIIVIKRLVGNQGSQKAGVDAEPINKEKSRAEEAEKVKTACEEIRSCKEGPEDGKINGKVFQSSCRENSHYPILSKVPSNCSKKF